MTEPPVPVVKRPKPRAAPEVWVSTMGSTMVAVALPVAVEVLPEAAKAGEAETRAMAEARMIFFTCMLPNWGRGASPLGCDTTAKLLYCEFGRVRRSSVRNLTYSGRVNG